MVKLRQNRIFIIFFCLMLILITFGSHQEAQAQTDSSVRRALLVGNWNYNNGTEILNGVADDLPRMQSVLTKSSIPPEETNYASVQLLTNATRQETLAAINSAFAGADASDISFFYFSGHGTVDEYGQAYLCPIDSTAGKYISVNDLEYALSRVAGIKVVVLDCCFSGGFIYPKSTTAEGETQNADSNSSDFLKSQAALFNQAVINAFSKEDKALLSSPSYKVLTSCAANEESFSVYDPEFKAFGGEFTNSFVKGAGFIENQYRADLNNDSIVTLDEMYKYTTLNVKLSQVQVYPYGDSFALVGKNNYIPVAGIEIQPSTLTLYTDETKQLKAVIYPSNATNKNVEWRSSNSAIAQVSSSGLITPLKAGSCTISAYAVDGGKAASCQITIKNASARGFQDFNLDLTKSTNVELNKIWTIKFNKNLEWDTVTQSNIYVADATGNIAPTTITKGEDDKTVRLIPSQPYRANELYNIFITPTLKATDGSSLRSGVLVTFYTIAGEDKLPAPQNFSAVAASESVIILDWDPVEEADYYYVYYSYDKEGPFNPFLAADGGKQPFFWVADQCLAIYNIEPNTTLYFKITAVKDGVESDYSQTVQATTFSDQRELSLKIVQQGTFEDYPFPTIQVAFESFFEYPSWDYFVSTENENVVEFNGICLYDNMPVIITIQFIVDTDNSSFFVCYAARDNEPLTYDEFIELLDAVYGEYRQEASAFLWQQANPPPHIVFPQTTNLELKAQGKIISLDDKVY